MNDGAPGTSSEAAATGKGKRPKKPKKQQAAAIHSATVASAPAHAPGSSAPCPADGAASTLPPNDNYVILQPGYATGDQFGIAATLVLDPRARVVITTEPPGPGRDPTDRGKDLAQFYSESVPGAEGRVKLLEVASIRDGKTSRNAVKAEVATLLIDPTKAPATGGQKREAQKGVGEGTTKLAELFQNASTRAAQRAKIREAWGVNDTSKDEAIRAWLAGKGVDPRDKSVVILWSRFSGKKGDIHMEHDTSFEGMRQITERAVQKNDIVILAGDPPIEKEGRGDKYGEIAALHPGKVVNLTGFWKENPEWCASRNDQLKLYDLLDRDSSSTKHLGFRSGNLEAMALVGHKVNYMEEPGSVGGSRMKKWEGQGIGYDRLEVSQPPTRSGKHLQSLLPTESEMQSPDKVVARDAKDRYAENKRPDWTPASRAKDKTIQKPEAVTALDKGFAKGDLDKIDAWLTP